MAAAYAVFVEGLTDLKEFEGLKDSIRLAATRAINSTAAKGRTMAARDIREQVNFPAAYLNPAGKRLVVSKEAQRNDLEARITARTRATSLARFISGTPTPNKAGVRVEVAPGRARFLKKAFVVRLRAGNASIDTKSNLGLAVRLKPGQVLRNKTDVQKLDSGLYLLFGPSVNQIFRARDGEGVANDIAPDLSDYLEREFLRLIDVSF
jgi:hypothetical protein